MNREDIESSTKSECGARTAKLLELDVKKLYGRYNQM